MDYAFKYIIDEGISTEEDYAYLATGSTCKKNTKKSSVKLTGFVDVEENEVVLKEAVGEYIVLFFMSILYVNSFSLI